NELLYAVTRGGLVDVLEAVRAQRGPARLGTARTSGRDLGVGHHRRVAIPDADPIAGRRQRITEGCECDRFAAQPLPGDRVAVVGDPVFDAHRAFERDRWLPTARR